MHAVEVNTCSYCSYVDIQCLSSYIYVAQSSRDDQMGGAHLWY